jgi:hypothetical protein
VYCSRIHSSTEAKSLQKNALVQRIIKQAARSSASVPRERFGEEFARTLPALNLCGGLSAQQDAPSTPEVAVRELNPAFTNTVFQAEVAPYAH